MSVAPNTSVDQIFDALDLLADSEDPIALADLARDLGLPTSTAHRVLATLQEAGLIERDSAGIKYELGVRAHSLVHSVFRQFPIQRVALPFVGKIAAQLGETVGLDVRVGWYVVRMAGFEGWREIHAGTRIGQTLPLAATAGGEAILAFNSDSEVDGYLRWEGGGRRSAARSRTLRERLERARAAGHSRRDGSEVGQTALALPVRSEGRAVAAVCVEQASSATDSRLRASDLRRVTTAVGQLERLIERNPLLARDPFAHLDPDTIDLLAPAKR